MSEPKLTIGMVYTSASKPSSRVPSHPLIASSRNSPSPASTEPQTDKEDDSEKKHNPRDFLSSLCAPGTDNIVLAYVSTEEKVSGQLLSPSGEATYRVHFQVNEHDGEVHRNSDDHVVGTWNQCSGRPNSLTFQFAWPVGKYDLDSSDGVWLSSIGTLSNHELKWMKSKEKKESNAGIATDADEAGENGDNEKSFMRCIDKTDPGERTVCEVAVDSCDHGTLTIPRHIIATSEQLDEMVTVSLAVMCQFQCRDRG